MVSKSLKNYPPVLNEHLTKYNTPVKYGRYIPMGGRGGGRGAYTPVIISVS